MRLNSDRSGLPGLVFVALLFAGGSACLAAPRAVLVEPMRQNAGKVEPGRMLDFTYTLRNEGDTPLSLEALEPTCYCTTAKADAWKIPPGGSTRIHVRIDPSDFVGEISKGVDIITNDPKNPAQMVEIDLDVRPGIAVVPPEIDFAQVIERGSGWKSVDLKAARERPFKVLGVESAAGFLEIDQEPLELEERAGIKLLVKVLPSVPPGPFKTEVVVRTSDEARPRIAIPVRGVGPGGLQIEPAKLLFKTAAPGSRIGTLELSGVDLEVQGVRSSTTSLETVLESLDGGRYRVQVTLAQGAKPGRLMGKLFVQTSDAAQPEVEVPVMGLVR